MIVGNSVYCDCCGTEKLALITDYKLVIYANRHGQKHVVTLDMTEILDILQTKFNNKLKGAELVSARH